MNIRYFPETDTLSVDFREQVGPVNQTIDGPDEDILLHFDEDGRLVAVLIEHASKRTSFDNFRQQPQFAVVGNEVRSVG